ncbi:MAG: hypothetical protein ABJC89_09605 [Acidobacteriota bacterium]
MPFLAWVPVATLSRPAADAFRRDLVGAVIQIGKEIDDRPVVEPRG